MLMRYHDLILLGALGGFLMDFHKSRVDNRWILLCLVAGLFAHGMRRGPMGVILGLSGMLLPFFLLYWMHVFHMLGAGDIKLLCALGCFLTPEETLRLIFHSFETGALISLCLLLYTGGTRERFAYLARYLRDTWNTRTIRPYILPGMERPENLHFTLPIFISTVLVALKMLSTSL